MHKPKKVKLFELEKSKSSFFNHLPKLFNHSTHMDWMTTPHIVVVIEIPGDMQLTKKKKEMVYVFDTLFPHLRFHFSS